jgi:MFS family permease
MGIMPFIAPVCGPIIGGVVSEAAGWRWTFWLTAIMAGTFEVLFLLLYRETYSVAILRQKTKRLRLKTGNLLLRSRHDGNTPTKLLLTRAIFRPLTLLVVSPVVLLVAICCALDMSYVYIIITNITGIYEQTYGFSERLAGFTYLGLGMQCSFPRPDKILMQLHQVSAWF